MVKRFYAAVDVRAQEDGFVVTLDGRPVRTPTGAPLLLPTRDLATAIAEEWAAQKDRVQPESMPLARLAVAAIEGVGRDREAAIERMLAYAETDLLCYRAQGPADLVARQEASWRPLLDWVNGACGASFTVTSGVMPVAQSPATALALRAALEPFDGMEIAALASATAATGSIILALALAAGCVDAEEAFAASMVDEMYQAEQWGEDAEAETRRQGLRREIQAAATFMQLAH
jgi:chaperone required for assembly of F1-ATPase